jgi:hypothetical protein
MSSRIILRHVDVETIANGKRAVVGLEFSGATYIGRRQLGEIYPPFMSVAQATLDAVNEVVFSRVKARVDFQLLHAQELQPDFLTRSLFVVAVNASIGHIILHLVGTVVADTQDWARATASATLDANNRLISYMLQLEGSV